jgi:hypothetical protein
VFKANSEEVRSVGKPRKRSENVVQQDSASFLRCRNWKLAANDTTLWRQKIERPRPDLGCSAVGWMDSVRTSKKTPHLTITNVNLLTMFKEITDI